MNIDSQELPHILVSACLEVHKQLGPHLLREAYLECVAQELTMREMVFDRDVPVEISYKGRKIESAFQFDFIVEHLIVLDIQTFPDGDLTLKDRHKDRVTSLLRLSGFETGLLINFHATDLRNGIKRLIVSNTEPAVRYR